MKTLNEINRLVLLSAALLLFSVYNASEKKDLCKEKFKKEMYQPYIVMQEDDFNKEREELAKRMEVLKGKIDKQLAELRDQSIKEKKETQKKYKADIDKLDAWSKKLDGNIKQTRVAQKEQWQEFKTNMNNYINDLEKQWGKIKKDIDKLFKKEKEV